MMLVQNIS